MIASNKGKSVLLKSLLEGGVLWVSQEGFQRFLAEIYSFVEKAQVSFKYHQSGLTGIIVLLLAVIISPA